MKAINLKSATQCLEANLEAHLKTLYGTKTPFHLAEYAVLPAGKLFRPLLAIAAHADYLRTEINTDLKSSDNIAYIASFLEIHHAYTLVHDDMPSMDNDDMRRGRPSHHKKFGEWQALLTGDALAIGSIHLLSKIKAKNTAEIIKLATWSTGAKGLIQGQYKDLSHEMNESFEELLETHLLKTARLIQLSLSLPLLLENASGRELKSMWRFGRAIGILFQLLDDLCELADDELSEHENDINPWLRYGIVEEQTLKLLSWILIHESEFGPNTKAVLQGYFQKILDLLTQGQKNIEKHSKRSLVPVMSALSGICAL